MVIIGSRVSIAGSPRLATVLELRANGKVRVRWDGHRPGNLGKEHTVDAASCVPTECSCVVYQRGSMGEKRAETAGQGTREKTARGFQDWRGEAAMVLFRLRPTGAPEEQKEKRPDTVHPLLEQERISRALSSPPEQAAAGRSGSQSFRPSPIRNSG